MRPSATLVLLLTAACAAEPPAPPPPPAPTPSPARLTELVPSLRGRLIRATDLPPSPDPADADYVVQPGDLVQIAPEEGPPLLRLNVAHDGRTRRAESGEPIDLPLVGMTRAEIRALFERQFGAHEGVRVHVRPHAACAEHPIAVIRDGGPVTRTAWRPGLRLHEVVEASADHAVWLLRRSSGRFILCDLWSYYATADVRHDPALESDDVVVLQDRTVTPDVRDTDLFLMLSLMERSLTPEEFAEAIGVGRNAP